MPPGNPTAAADGARWAGPAALCVAGAITARAARSFFEKYLAEADISLGFQSENAFYYSFYSHLVRADSWWDGLCDLYADRLSEAPAEVNALRRFNIYQEALLGMAWRGAAAAVQSLGLAAAPDPARFYCASVFVAYFFGVLALLWNVRWNVWCVLVAGASYLNNLEDATHVAFMPPLRENFGIPLWFASCASLQWLHRQWSGARPSGLGAPRASLVLACSGFLLSWQFANFALSLQWAAVCAVAVSGATGWPFVVEVSRLYVVSVLLSSALRFGDLWAVRSVFFRLSLSAVVAGRILQAEKTRCDDRKHAAAPACLDSQLPSPARLLAALAAALGTAASVGWAARRLVARRDGEEALLDDAHIFEFVAFRFGLRPGPLGYHAALYEGQRSFSSPAWPDWEPLCTSLAAPAAALVAAVVLLKLLWRQRRRWCHDELACRDMFPEALLLALAGSVTPLFLVMLRYQILFVPHVVLLGSLAADSRLWPPRLRACGPLLGTGLRAAWLAVLLGRWVPRGPLEVRRGPHADELAERSDLLAWIAANTRDGDIVVSGMGLSALIRLHARRGVVCHPHYENTRLRERCHWVERINGWRSLKEYHGILRDRVLPGPWNSSGRILVAEKVQSCFGVDEAGRDVSEIIERNSPEQAEGVRGQKACEQLHLMAGGWAPPRGFQPLVVGRWYALVEVLEEPQRKGKPLQLSLESECRFARYLFEELSRSAEAQPFFLRLLGSHGQRAHELDVPCACAASYFWPPDVKVLVHRRALELRRGWADGALGCCELTPRAVDCLSAHARALHDAGDYMAAERYHGFATELLPGSAQPHGFRGFALLQDGRLEAALESFRRAAALEGSRASSTTGCGMVLALSGLGRFAEAREQLAAVARFDPRAGCMHAERGLRGLGASAELQPELEAYADLRLALRDYDGGISGWHSFLDSSASARYLTRRFRGSKVLFLGSADKHLNPALVSLKVLRRVHRCDWPAEFWIEAGELYRVDSAQREALALLGAELRVLPSPYAAWRGTFWHWRANLTQKWNQGPGADGKLQKYALKTLVLLLSSCSDCLFLDADNVALRAPSALFEGLAAHEAAVFWPDLWDEPAGSAAALWASLPPPAAPAHKTQESGQLVVRKSGRQALRALLLAALLAVRGDVFLEAIYGLEGGGLLCGYGDKDAFHLGFRLLGVPFRWGAPLPSVLVSSRDGSYVGQLQLGSDSGPLFLHGAHAKDNLMSLLRLGLDRCDFRSGQGGNLFRRQGRTTGVRHKLSQVRVDVLGRR
ncbi:unnamed protein product [Prorocentrum cordatum]|uniref:Mannosyltransferase n=1 Tax=Prorocentrum cordatum TaxID=2364126 RepID=A0ABN9XF46_9DINO|nr:unnamed protein product [Polarella glacialis]